MSILFKSKSKSKDKNVTSFYSSQKLKEMILKDLENAPEDILFSPESFAKDYGETKRRITAILIELRKENKIITELQELYPKGFIRIVKLNNN